MRCKKLNRMYQTPLLIAIMLALFGVSSTSGFMITSSPSTKRSFVQHRSQRRRGLLQNGSPGLVYHSAVIDSSSMTISAESWRQYVPLVVSVVIIIDILFGSPLANAVLKPMRPEEERDGEEKDKKIDGKPRSKARIDAEMVAKQAIDKANNTLELRKFLDERKTDYDRMEEMKRKLDSSMQDLDEDLEARQKTIDETKAN